jgi:hypothetical protein
MHPLGPHMEERRIPCTQLSLLPNGGTPCSVIAVLTGLAFLQAAPHQPTLAQLVHRMQLGCTVWAALVAPQRTDLFARDRMVGSEYVLSNVVDVATRAAPWVHVAMLLALHLPPGVQPPDGARQFLAELAPRPQGTPDSIDMRVLDGGVHAMLEFLADTAERTQRSHALVVTYGNHSIVVAAVLDTHGISYHAVDSLTGSWLLVTDNPAPLFARVASAWCPPTDDTLAAYAVANMFGLTARL